jgi:hypothetical protein
MYKVISGDGKQVFGRGYATEEDAQAFIDAHLSAQKVKAKVVEDEQDGVHEETSDTSSAD